MRRVNKNERTRVALTLNDRKLAAEAEPRMLLSDFLRHALGATGTHVGCEHGVCGFCTPGILMSFTDFLGRNPHPTEEEIREVLSGHLCRCTGYAGIVAAIKEAAGGP